MPHLAGQLPASNDSAEDFYRSFGLLCAHYGITPMETLHLGYPYGRAVALWEARRLLRGRQAQIEIAENNDTGTAVLQTVETYNTGTTLYYIPVVPLHGMLQSRSTKKAAQLLLCTCAYLYQVAGIPYYTEQDSYLSWQYDMLREWVEDDPEGWEQDDYNSNRNELNAAAHIGAIMGRRLYSTYPLSRFAQLTEQFVPVDPFGYDCLAIARKALALWGEHPQGQLYRHADLDVLEYDEEEGYNEQGCITMDKYIGFCARTTGWLYRSLAECVNGEFGECSDIQQPVLKRTFDGQPQEQDSLDFDCRLFALMDDLCYLLNTFEDENNS